MEECLGTLSDIGRWRCMGCFETQFRKKFISEHIATRKQIEFLLGKITVLEYIHQFMRLSWFAQVLIDT